MAHWASWGLFSSALFIYLFYLDEGYYSFNWMLEPGAWLVFVFYAGLSVLSQWLIWRFAFWKQPKLGILLSALLGPIGWWGLFFGSIYVVARVMQFFQ
jgi:hypothetical protein